MERVEIRFPTSTLAPRLGAMRTWLDNRGCEPISFAFKHGRETTVASLTFHRRVDAAAFAARFGRDQAEDAESAEDDRPALLLTAQS